MSEDHEHMVPETPAGADDAAPPQDGAGFEVEELTPDGAPADAEASAPEAPAHTRSEASGAADPELEREPPTLESVDLNEVAATQTSPGAQSTAEPADDEAAAETEDDTETESDEPAADEAEPARRPRRKRAAKAGVDVSAAAATATHVDADEDEAPPELVWYVLKVQSGREDSIRDALERRVKMHGLDRYFGRIVVPTEKITEIRNNKKRVVERKSYPGYIMVEMELNEKTWFVVRETPGVGDFVGAHGSPTKMTEDEVNKMLGQETAKDEKAAPVRIHVERGDRVKIKDGPFENFEGTVEEVIEQRGLVKVMLIIFNRPTPVDLEYWQVERL